MKTPEDEAFDDLARKQGDWGGGYQAKRKMAADKLQEPAQEPVAFICQGNLYMAEDVDEYCTATHIPLYTTPPKREWVGLTDEEREQHRNDWHSNIHDKEFYAIEAKLKEKNT